MNTTSSSVNDCTLVDFPVSGTDTAFLVAPLRNGIEAPFPIKRMYYLFDIPDDKVVRGGHAHKALQQIIIALNGSFSLKLSDGLSEKIVILDSPFTGVHLVPGIWRELYDFTPGATCMVLASEVYDEKDYIRRYDEFLSYKQQPNGPIGPDGIQQKFHFLRSNVVKGKTIDLHPYGMEYLDEIIRLRNQDAVKYFLAQDFDITRQQQQEWIRGYEKRTDEFGFIICNKKGEVVGITFCYNYDGRSMEIGRATFDTQRLMGMPYALETYSIIADLVFNYLQLSVLKVVIKSDNHRLLKFYQRMNWTHTGKCSIRGNDYETLQVLPGQSAHASFEHFLDGRKNKFAL